MHLKILQKRFSFSTLENITTATTENSIHGTHRALRSYNWATRTDDYQTYKNSASLLMSKMQDQHSSVVP